MIQNKQEEQTPLPPSLASVESARLGLRLSLYELENNNIIIPTKRVLKSNGKWQENRKRETEREKYTEFIVNRFYSESVWECYAGCRGYPSCGAFECCASPKPVFPYSYTPSMLDTRSNSASSPWTRLGKDKQRRNSREREREGVGKGERKRLFINTRECRA